MDVFRSMYEGIAPNRARGKAVLFVVDVLLLAAIMIGTPLIRKSVYGSISLGSDLVAAFLLGFFVLVSFNALVYFGSVFSNPTEDGA